MPLRQDYGTKVNLFSHLHQYSRKKPLTQQMRYGLRSPGPWQPSGSASAGLADEGMSWCCLRDRLGGVEGDPSLALRSGGSRMPCPAGEESCPRAMQGRRTRGRGVSLAPLVAEQGGAGLAAPCLGCPWRCLAGGLVMGWLFLGCSAGVESSLVFVPAASPPR